LDRPDHTLQPTALVHEAYLRLVNTARVQHWESRGHFFAAAAEAMRRILVNRARDRQRLKRGGQRKKFPLDRIETVADAPDECLLELDEALQKLAAT
jgi:RNA polymerase sigma factor (TIGR02999 family)